MTTDERERLKGLERENRELRQANPILKSASVFFAKELDGPREVSAFIDEQKAAGFAVELVCRTLGVSASAYYPSVRQLPRVRQVRLAAKDAS